MPGSPLGGLMLPSNYFCPLSFLFLLLLHLRSPLLDSNSEICLHPQTSLTTGPGGRVSAGCCPQTDCLPTENVLLCRARAAAMNLGLGGRKEHSSSPAP